jgi:hypothetical protein
MRRQPFYLEMVDICPLTMVVYMWALPVSTLTFNELAADTLR